MVARLGWPAWLGAWLAGLVDLGGAGGGGGVRGQERIGVGRGMAWLVNLLDWFGYVAWLIGLVV